MFKKILIYVIIFFVICFSTELIKNEIFTLKYGKPFKNADSHISMMGDEEYFKVLDYSDDMADIYYVSNEMSSASIVRLDTLIINGNVQVIQQYGQLRAVRQKQYGRIGGILYMEDFNKTRGRFETTEKVK